MFRWECPVAKGVLEAGMGHVGGDTPFEKFTDVLTMRGDGLHCQKGATAVAPRKEGLRKEPTKGAHKRSPYCSSPALLAPFMTGLGGYRGSPHASSAFGGATAVALVCGYRGSPPASHNQGGLPR